MTASSPTAYNADYYALDFGIPAGGTVSSVAVGRVIVAQNQQDGYGNKVVLDHGGGIYSVYAHFGTSVTPVFGPGIVVGAFIPQGKVVGYSGNTGNTLGVHLHIHMQSSLSAMNPEPLSGYSGFVSVGLCGSTSPSYISSQAEIDGDGYPDNHENYFDTRPAFHCPFTSFADDEAIDNWPPDFDDNRVINTTDVFQLLPPVIGSVRDANGNWSPSGSDRQDLAPNGVINTTDTYHVLPPVYGSSCTP